MKASDVWEHYSKYLTRLDGCDACQADISQLLRVLGACFRERASRCEFPNSGYCLLWGQGGPPQSAELGPIDLGCIHPWAWS